MLGIWEWAEEHPVAFTVLMFFSLAIFAIIVVEAIVNVFRRD